MNLSSKFPPLKLTFTPDRLTKILLAGLAAEGFHFDGNFDEVINIEETMGRQGRDNVMVPVYLITIPQIQPSHKPLELEDFGTHQTI